jgi:NADH dehydrogenase
MKTHVVIVGGGFGGVYTAKYLKPLIEAGKIEVTLINKTNYFLFTPLLHEVATGGLSATSVVEPIREIFRKTKVHFIQDEVTSIDTAAKQVRTTSSTISYDYLILAGGAETNYYGTLGAKENTLTLKDLGDAQILRKRIIDMCEKGALAENEAERKRLLSCIVVGAGPTGVELAVEIMEFMKQNLCSYYHKCGLSEDDMKVSLVAASPDVLPQFPPELRPLAHRELIRKGIHVLTNEQVVEVKPGKIMFKDKSFLEAGTVIWVAGVKPTTLDITGIEKEKSGRIKVNEFLQVAGFPNVYSLGDISGNFPMLAQVATQQAKTVAANISATIRGGEIVPFVYKEKGLLVSLGQWYAVGKIFGIVMKGPLMWWVWRTVYLFNFHSWRKRVKIALDWTIDLFYPRDITEA